MIKLLSLIVVASSILLFQISKEEPEKKPPTLVVNNQTTHIRHNYLTDVYEFYISVEEDSDEPEPES